MKKLSPAQIALRLKMVPLWRKRGSSILRLFEFDGFMKAIEFVDRVARTAEKHDHHPDIDVRWNKVTLTLTTHSKGGLTANDFDSAERMGAIYSRFFEPR